MPIPREDVTRLLGKIDQELPDYYQRFVEVEKGTNEAKSILYGLVSLEAARKMAEDKLSTDEDLSEEDWFTLLSLYRVSNSWFG